MGAARRTARSTPKPASANAAKPVSVQRLPDGAAAPQSADASLLIGDALASPSRPLDSRTRAFVEPRLGHDFSRVRLHADGPAATTARALNARAFTLGDHVFFGAGHQAPESQGGMRVLVHELAHVVQQRSGEVDGSPGPGGLRLSDPSDRFERAAESVADKVMAHRPGAAPAMAPEAAHGPSRPGAIQRFLAGEEGHRGIEEVALRHAGFTKDEAHETYYGNWLRDFSQRLDVNSSDTGAMLEIIQVLAEGEFGRTPSAAELGKYLPSEHVDRPQDGKSAENPDIDADAWVNRRAALSPAQRAWFDEENTKTFQNENKERSEASGLPEYIERAKEHAKRQIKQAAALGRNREGFEALGNGLHAVEDYFAHSNFVEVATRQLRHEGEVSEDNPRVLALDHYEGIDDPGNIGTDKFGRPQIVTGTSAPGANDRVGTWEVVKTELRNQEIRSAFIRGAAIRWGRELPKAALRYVGGGLGAAIGGAAGAVGGLFAGAGRGAAAGWRGARHWWQKPFAALGGLFSGAATGAVHGAARAGKAGWRVGSKVGGALGRVLGPIGRVAVTPAVAVVIASLNTLVNLLAAPAQSRIIRHAKTAMKEGTRASMTDPKGVALPTHSQIAKDDPDQPLHDAAGRLAQVADEAIGRAMIEVWRGHLPVEKAQALVDTYMAHPAVDPWWQPTLIAALKGGPDGKKAPQ